jgi:mono/diheme cytochrome c family protein
VLVRFALACVVLAACDRERAGGSLDGAEIFRTQCATCHGGRGRPPEAMVARLGVKDLTARDFRAKVTAELVGAQVRHGSQNKLMPSFAGALSEAQIEAVAAYVASPGFVAAR